jgi:hypothetical protein
MTHVPGSFRWTDCGYLAGYRIQGHHRDGSYRLLDPRGTGLLRASLEDCRARLADIARRDQLQPCKRETVVLLHGLSRNAWSMASLERHLRRVWPEVEVICFQYASLTGPVDGHARCLTEFLEVVREAPAVHFVAHSLGNIVLRRVYKLAEEGRWTLPRLGRHVMLGPPNQGSHIAKRLTFLSPLVWFNGASFLELGRDWDTFREQLAIPPCPFGIVAGRLAALDRRHVLLQGPNDVLVSVAETRLPGAADFLEVAVGHAWLMNSRVVQRATVNFLKTGRFAEAVEGVVVPTK